MRARRREINIFNMSLLDILCGALGAFCFMMLVALPYYIPPGSGLELRKAQEETDRLLLAIGNLKDRMPDQKSVEEMEKLMRELEAQVKALQGRVNILTAEKEEMLGKVKALTAEKDQLRAQMEKLAAEKQELQEKLNRLAAEKKELQEANQQLTAKAESLTTANERLAKWFKETRTFSLIARADSSFREVDLLFSTGPATERGETFKAGFKDWLGGKSDARDSFRDFLGGLGTAIKTSFRGKVGTQYRVYLKAGENSGRGDNTTIVTALFGGSDEGLLARIPKVTLTPERSWTLLGTVTIDENYAPVFKEATAAERDAEWTALTASTPPPTATPTPPPSEASLKAAAEERAKRRELHLKFSRLLRLRPTESGENDAEILSLTDELIKALPPGDMMRREAESARERTLELKKRREHEPAGRTSPNDATPPPRPRRSAAPVPSPTS